MTERRAAGFNIPLNFYDGPEVQSIPRRIRAAAIGVWALAGDYAATQLTDGYVGAEVLKSLGCTDAIRATLEATVNKKGDLSPLWTDARNGGIQLTNWAKHQRTNAEVTTYRRSDAERKRAEREKTKQAPTSDDAKMSERTKGGVRVESRDPKTKTETKTEIKERVVTLGSGSRLPDDWKPPTEVVAQMRSDHPHVNLYAEHAKFVDHWRAQPGAKGRKADWPATWRNWIRRAAEQPARNGSPMSTSDLRVAQAQALKNKPNRLEIE